MKILLVIHGFPPKQAAGSEIYTFVLAKALSKKDEVTVLTRDCDLKQEEYAVCRKNVDNFKVITINNTYKFRQSYSDKIVNHQIGTIFQKFLTELKPDIVHIGHLVGLSSTIIDEAKKYGIPVVFTLHDFWLICPTGRFIKRHAAICPGPSMSGCKTCLAPQLFLTGKSNRLIRLIKKRMGSSKIAHWLYTYLEKSFKFFSMHQLKLNKAADDRQILFRQEQMQKILNITDCFIAPSKFLLKKFVSFGLPENKAIYLDYGFDTTPFTYLQKKESSKLRLGYIGTLIPPKGIHVLMNAFSQIESKNVELRIHGDFDKAHDEYKGYSHKIRSFFNAANIFWFGSYANHDLNMILSEIDLLVVPSIWFENSPLVIHEAFLAKIPVITSRAGGMEELVQHEVNGLLFEIGNSEDLKNQLQKIIDKPSLIKKYKANIPKVTAIHEHASDIRKIYELQIKHNIYSSG